MGPTWQPDDARELQGHIPANAAAGYEMDRTAFAKSLGRELRKRNEIDPDIDDARWMILLDIFVAMADGRETPLMSAAHASSVAVTTAQRYIHEMIDGGWIAQNRSGADQRITLVNLTREGAVLVERMLDGTIDMRRRLP